MKKLAIVSTHPIQYYAPIFQLLHNRKAVEIKVFYTWGEKSIKKHDPGFDKIIEWDVPLLYDYPFEWVNNTSNDPGSHHFFGIKNPELIGQIKNFNPDALLIFGWAYKSHLQVLLHFNGKIPVYFRGDSTLLDEKVGLKNFFKGCFLKWIYSHVNHGFYVGTANKKYFLKYGFKQTQLSFTPHAADNMRYAADRSLEAQELRGKLGLKNNDILILFAGKFEAKKDPCLLLKAFKEINKPNVHLLFAGNGELEMRLKEESNTPNAVQDSDGKTISFLDFQNQTQMPVLYQACDLFCLPSKGPGESWGLVINEAMACGKAILASDKVGSIYDLVKEGENGLIFKSGNLGDLKEKIEHLTSSKENLYQFGKRSKEIINGWDFETIASVLENTLITEPPPKQN